MLCEKSQSVKRGRYRGIRRIDDGIKREKEKGRGDEEGK